MFDQNSVEITGTMTADPKHLTTRNNHDWSYFSVCVRRPEPSKAVDYINVTAWNENATRVCEGFHAGDRIKVQGRLQKQTYTGTDGMKRFDTRIIAEKIERPRLSEEDDPDFDRENTAE